MTRLYKAILERHESGLWPAEIARQTGFSQVWVSRILRANGIEPNAGGRLARPSVNTTTERIEKMAGMYRQGLTLAKIGETFGITRERVRQLLKRHGMCAEDGGACKAAQSKKTAHVAKRDARSIARYGLPVVDMNKWRSAGLVSAYRNQENGAKARGIEWGMNFAQWLDVWQISGKLDQRGRGKGHYVMSRIKDCGGYVVGNVHIQLSTENSLEAVNKWRGKEKTNRGVFHLYPGLTTPYMAKVGKLSLGLFPSEEAAVAARTAYLQANGYEMSKGGRAVQRAA